MKLQSGDAAGVTWRRAAKNQGADTTSSPPQLAWQQTQTKSSGEKWCQTKDQIQGRLWLKDAVPCFLRLPSRAPGWLCDLPGRPWIELLGMSLQNQRGESHPLPPAYLFFIWGGPAGSLGGGEGLPLLFCARGDVGAGHGGDGVGADLGVLALGRHHGHDRLGQAAAGRVLETRVGGRRWRSGTAAVSSLGAGFSSRTLGPWGPKQPGLALSKQGLDLRFAKVWLLYALFKFFSFWPCCGPCRILGPRPGIKPEPLALEARSLNHWTPGKSLSFTF